MNMKVLFFNVALLLALWSCGGSAPQEKQLKQVPDSPVCTLVFIDKSVSVNVNRSFVDDKYQRILSEAIEQNIRYKGDRLEVYYIHENTAKGKALQVVCRSEMEDISQTSATDAESIKTAFDLSLKKEKIQFKQLAIQKLHTANTSESNQATDIWASLAVIDQLASIGFDVKVYYFSDMIESMKEAGRRDFHNNPPKNSEEAEAWAKTDANTMKNRYPNLSIAEIKLILPFEPTTGTHQNNPAITTYWQTLFNELGVSQPVEELF
jgi:hypothetical protein